MAAAKRKTREQLEAEIETWCAQATALRTERDGAAQHAKQLRSDLDEVKERLAFAEAELQRAGGYIQRVQEDDVVREELVETGDPGGEKHLLPKRKPTHFSAQIYHNPQRGIDAAMRAGNYSSSCERRRYWVTY